MTPGTPRWARALVEEALAHACGQLGLDFGAIKTKADAGPAQPRVTVTMPRHHEMTPDQHERKFAIQPGPSADAAARRIALAMTIPFARILAREEQLARAGEEPLPVVRWTTQVLPEERCARQRPAWAYTIQPVALAELTRRGRTPDDIVGTGLYNAAFRLHSMVDGHDYEINRTHVEIRRLELEGAHWEDPGHAGRPELRIGTLPETIRLAIRRHKGKPLASVVDHPLLNTLDLEIAGWGRHGIAISRPADVTVEPVPNNLGPAWNMIGENL